MERCLGCMNEYDASFDICPHCGYVKGTAEQSKNHLSPGTVLIDRYLIGRCLGQGGFGITYIAWDQRLYKKVAIKEFMPTSLASRITGQMDITCYNDEAQERFQNGIRKMLDESRRLARFNDLEGVVKVYDCFEANQTAYIIMELLDGENIKTILAQQQTIDLAQTAKIMLPVLQVLKEVHASGLVHRDISPDNIFVCKNGKVKLLDFGSARVASGTDDKSLSVILKPGYAPKEQYSASATQGPFTDVYAVCATIYKMLTGITPVDSLERQVQNDELAPISTLVAMPKRLAHAVEQGLAVEAKDRLQTVEPLLDAFQSIDVNASAPTAYKKKKPKKAKKSSPAKRKKIRLMIGIVLACAIVAAAGFGGLKGWRFMQARRAQVTDVDPTEGEREYSAYEQQLLQKASVLAMPTEQLPDAQQREKILKKYADSLVYSTDAGKLCADYTDADGRLLLHEQRTLPKNEAAGYTLYAYAQDGRKEAVVQFLADGTVASAERYFYDKDGSLFALSTYTEDTLTSVREFTEYDAQSRPVAAVLRNADGSEESVAYTYNDSAELETRTDASGDTVYERTHFLDDNEVKEIWYSGSKEFRRITRKVDGNGRPTEFTETEYGRQKTRCTWTYNNKSGRLEKNAAYNKDNVQQAAVLFKYVDGKLRYIIEETEADVKTYQLDLEGGYVRYAFQGKNMTVREEFAADDTLVGRIETEYDDDDHAIRQEYYDKNDALTKYYADYTYRDSDKSYTFTEYDADGDKQHTYDVGEAHAYTTEFDAEGREVRYTKVEESVLILERTTAYSGSTTEITTVSYDKNTQKQTSKRKETYTDERLRTEEEYDRNDVKRKERTTDANGRTTEVTLYREDGSRFERYALDKILGVEVVRRYNSNNVPNGTVDMSDMNDAYSRWSF